MRYSILTLFITLFTTLLYAEEPQKVHVPATWTFISDQEQQLPSDDDWWKEFNDPTLDSLIQMSIDNNFNLAVALDRINIAKQNVRQAQAGYYPQFNLSAGWNKSRSSGNNGNVSTPPSNVSYFNAGVDMNWEIDVFGRVTSLVKAKKANLNVAKVDYLAVMNSLCAQIASSYLELRTLQERLQVANNHLASQKEVLRIAVARYDAGLNSKLDVAQAATLYNSTEASIPEIKYNIYTTLNTIALLTGVYSNELPNSLRVQASLPDYYRLVAVGVPMDLLRRRPDIREAEFNMAAAAAEIGVAKKDFMPTLTLNGSIGVSSHKLNNLFKGRSVNYTIAPTLSWTIFDGFSRSAALASAKENLKMEVNSYNLTVMTAINEVENAMANYNAEIETIKLLEKVVEQSKEQLDLSLDLYKQGLVGFLNVAQAQSSYLQYSDQLAMAHGQVCYALVNLYKALGGGWKI